MCYVLVKTRTLDQTLRLKREIIATGKATTARANQSKCHGPSQQLKILGMMYDAVAKRCSLSQPTVEKYICRVTTVLEAFSTSKDLKIGRIIGLGQLRRALGPTFFLSYRQPHYAVGAFPRASVIRYTRMSIIGNEGVCSGTYRNSMVIPQSRLPIAYTEFIAVLVGFSVFAENYSNQLVTLYSDKTDVVS